MPIPTSTSRSTSPYTLCFTSPCLPTIPTNPRVSHSKSGLSVYNSTIPAPPPSPIHVFLELPNYDQSDLISSKSPIFTTSISASSSSSSGCSPTLLPPSTSPPTPSHSDSIDYAGRICSVPMLPMYHGPLVEPDTLTIYNYSKTSSSSPLFNSKSCTADSLAPQSSISRKLSLINSSRRSLRAFASTVKRRLHLSRPQSRLTEASSSTNRRVCQQELLRGRSHSAKRRKIENPFRNAVKK